METELIRDCKGCDKCSQSQQILCILDYVKENNELLTLILSKLNKRDEK